MYDVSEFSLGAVLDKQRGRVFNDIYYSSKTNNNPQVNYDIIEKELLANVFAFEKFQI